MKKRNFKFIKELGSGEYGKVFLVLDRKSEKTFALKRMSKRYIRKYGIERDIRNEVKIHMKLDHPNIIKFYDYFEDSKFVYFLIEYADRGDLFTIDISEEADDFLEKEILENTSNVYDVSGDAQLDKSKGAPDNPKENKRPNDTNNVADTADSVGHDESHNESCDESCDESEDDSEDDGRIFRKKNKKKQKKTKAQLLLGDKYEQKLLKTKEKICKHYVRQLILALQYLHQNNIAHRDIKLENMLVSNKDELKVCDFGFAIKFNQKVNKDNEKCGTLEYFAPEMIKKGNYNYGPDIWTVGVFAYDIFFYHTPFTASKESVVEKKILKCNVQFPKNKKCSSELRDFIRKILIRQPSKRMTLAQMLEHPWLKAEA